MMHATETELGEPRVRLRDHCAERKVEQHQRLVRSSGNAEGIERLARGDGGLHGRAPGAADAPYNASPRTILPALKRMISTARVGVWPCSADR